MSKFLWKIGGEAGFGIMTTGLNFSKVASRSGYQILDYVEYPSLIRGGHNAYEVTVADEPVNSLSSTIDYLVCLNKETFERNKKKLIPASIVVYDQSSFTIEENCIRVNLPINDILKESKGQIIMANTIALGASLALLDGDQTILNGLLKEEFGKKGNEIVRFNQQFAEKGFDYIKNNYPQFIKPVLHKKNNEEKLVMTGNEAFSLGAVAADCRFYAAYPMTPASSVLTDLAAWQERTGMVVRHAEDEIAVINSAIGASFAGVRSAVGTSGGGFALMTETVSLAGITETSLVIFIAQRPGPATGMPTWTEQGDLLFSVHAGHGEFPKIVLAPGDHEEMFELTLKAFDLADIYQTPVIILSDMLLSESHRTLSKVKIECLIKAYQANRGKLINHAEGKYLRYKLSNDGISERLVPGAEGQFYQANSYEHLEDGHTTEESLRRREQVDKRNAKIKTYLANHFQPPKVYGDLEKAQTVFVSWGSTKGVISDILDGSTSLIHFNHVYPLDERKIRPLFKPGKRYVLVENNSQGQFGKLLRQETGIEVGEKILKYDGRPIGREEIIKRL